MSRCPKCKAAVQAQSRFCDQCGATVGSGTVSEQRTVIVGRDKDCDLVIDRQTVSARHASFVDEGRGNLRATDLNSANGLWVNDPYSGTQTFAPEADFRRSFAYLGNMALIVGPSEGG